VKTPEKQPNNSYVIAIPSYKRENILREQTLAMLKSNKIPSQLVYIFVANKEEEAIYKSAIPSEYKIVVGVKGLSQQRQFISNYFKEGKEIIQLDDDVKKIVLSNSPMFKSRTLDYFFNYAFKLCIEEGSYIWGIYPANNAYFMKNRKEYTTELNYIVGCCFGIINRHSKDLKLTISPKYNGNKEDVERSILYFIKDNKVLRFNKVSFETKYYNNTGGIGTFEERLKPMREASLALEKKYPEYGYIQVRPSGMTEFKLRKIKSGVEIDSDTEDELEGGKLKNEDLDRDNPDNTKVLVDKIIVTPKIKQLQDKLVELISNAKIPPVNSGFYSSGSKKRGEIIGSKGYTFNLGGGRRRFKPVGEFKQNKDNPELFKTIVEYANLILPTGFEYSVITLNKNLKAKKHKDGGNDGLGCITFLGDYTGGGLYIYDDKDKPTLYPSKNVVIAFNGARLAHKTEAFKGDRYAMIFYQQVNKYKVKGISMVGSGLEDYSDLKIY